MGIINKGKSIRFKKFSLIFIGLLFSLFIVNGQSKEIVEDSINEQIKNLDDITIVGRNSRSEYQKMPEIIGTSIYAGKKTALVIMDKVQGNVVNNTMRQILSKIAGIHIWESDPSGIQVGIAARGLSPNRSWEFNVRQNGYDIAADPYGYPEAYYNPPMQGVQRIEIIRGQGALQYGPQFGGMINYILKNGSEISKPFEFESQQTFGSNGLFNTYNALGGKTSKAHYYTYFNHRDGKGWRNNSQFFVNSSFSSFTFLMNDKLSITGEMMISHSRSQQPGGLTDTQFQSDPQFSSRNRNWFDIKWTTPALIFNYHFNNVTRWNTKIFGVIGNRNSVGFTSSILINDSINSLTNNYNNRVLNADQYRNFGIESKLLSTYKINKSSNDLLLGFRAYSGSTKREANGKGSVGSNYDMTALSLYPQALNFNSNNFSVFGENIFRIKNNFLIIPGFRYEWIEGAAKGRIGYKTDGTEIAIQNIIKQRQFLLGGLGIQYNFKNKTEIYSNISQAYRPIQFSNLQAVPSTDSIDEKLSDAKGYNIDFGYRGKIKNYIQFDVSAYYLSYENRIGIITPTGTSQNLITNVGNSTSKGVESFVECYPFSFLKPSATFDLSIFCSYSYTYARYNYNHMNENTKGKWVENAPRNIVRTGVNLKYNSFFFTAQYSFVDKTFSDANNTLTPTANGQTGLIPSYQILDCSFSFKIKKQLEVKSGINNLLNQNYFTRRAGGYPGPGVLPGDGRNYFISIGAKF